MKGRGSVKERCSGFVLLIVVITLAIVCLLLYQLAAVTQERVREVVDSQRNLRSRWAFVSLRQSLLSSGPSVIEAAEQRQNLFSTTAGPALYSSKLQGEVRLAGIDFNLRLDDESAKLKVPSLLASRPEAEARQYIERLIPHGRVQLKRAFEGVGPWCWSDFFILDRGSNESGQVSGQLTLWGDGRLNVYRTDEEVLNLAWRAVFGHFPPGELIKSRESYPPTPWEQLIDRLDLRHEDRAKANQWFTTESKCFSLTIEPAATTSPRKKRFIMDLSDQHFSLDE